MITPERREYNRVHQWIKRHYEKSNVCENCGKVTKTQWANKDGLYDTHNRASWLELCPKCHYAFDIAIHNLKHQRMKAKRIELRPLKPSLGYARYRTIDEIPKLSYAIRKELTLTPIIYKDSKKELLKRLRTYPWFQG